MWNEGRYGSVRSSDSLSLQIAQFAALCGSRAEDHRILNKAFDRGPRKGHCEDAVCNRQRYMDSRF